MTSKEWGMIAAKVVAMFGTSSKWARFDDTYEQVRDVSYRAASDAVNDAFNNGRTFPPTMSEIVTAARNRGGSSGMTGPCRHDTFAIFTYHDDGTASEGTCIGCRTSMTWQHGTVRTVGDWEERVKERRERYDAVAP